MLTIYLVSLRFILCIVYFSCNFFNLFFIVSTLSYLELLALQVPLGTRRGLLWDGGGGGLLYRWVSVPIPAAAPWVRPWEMLGQGRSKVVLHLREGHAAVKFLRIFVLFSFATIFKCLLILFIFLLKISVFSQDFPKIFKDLPKERLHHLRVHVPINVWSLPGDLHVTPDFISSHHGVEFNGLDT